MVPIHLDVLSLPVDTSVKSRLLDFTKLPWGDNNTYKPYLSDTITSRPLSDTSDDTVSLPQGNHLHWALPDALTKAMHIPLVYKQAFVNMFGKTLAETVWSDLITLKWLIPDSRFPRNNAAIIAEASARSLPAQPPVDIVKNLSAIQSILSSRNFPATPNRWLITQKVAGKATGQWVLESDFQGQTKDSLPQATVFPQNTDDPSTQPYLFTGKKTEIAQWHEPDADGNSAEHMPVPLSAVGFGEPSFAAFYPNSMQMFGFHDETAQNKTPEYELIGWYSRPELDYFLQFIQYENDQWATRWNTTEDDTSALQGQSIHYKYLDLIQSVHEGLGWELHITLAEGNFSENGQKNSPGTIFKGLQDLGWLDAQGKLQPEGFDPASILSPNLRADQHLIFQSLNAAIKAQLPGKSVFYASHSYAEGPPATAAKDTPGVKLAVGNTGPEAMAALLASELSQQEAVRDRIEDHLEAIQLSAQLSGRKLDVGSKFEEFRHAKAFTAEPGGSQWNIHTRSSTNNKASKSAPPTEVTLPEHLGDLLNELNILQQACDKAGFRIESLRRRIFTDWCAFQHATHEGKEIDNPIISDPGGSGDGGITISDPGGGDDGDGGITISG